MHERELLTPLRPREGVLARPSPTGALLLDMHTGHCFETNRVGAEVWALVDGVRTARELCAALKGKPGIPQDRLEQDVLGFLQSLKEQGLIEPADKGDKG